MHFILKLKTASKQQAPIVASCFVLLSLINIAQSVERRNYNHNHDEIIPARHEQHNRQNLSRSSLDQQSQDHPSSLDSSQDSDRTPDSTDSSDSSESDSSSDASGEDSLLLPPVELEVFRLNDTSVVIKWEINESALDRLTFFKIQYKSTKKGADWKTDPREILTTTRCLQINGLRAGNYFFIVSAVYDNLDNKPSKQYKFRLRARSKISAEDMPNQDPPDVYWHEAQVDYIRFKWRYSVKEKDMPWFGYFVYYRSAHSMTDFTIHRTLDESVELAELEPDTPYEAKIVAYNNYGVSEFSELMRVKTKPNITVADNGTSIVSTTKKPIGADFIPERPSSSPPVASGTTPAPTPSTIPRPSHPPHSDGNDSPTYNLPFDLDLAFRFMFGSQIDTAPAIKYALLVMVPIIFIGSCVICLMSCHQRHKPSPSSSTSDSMESCDLEINGYFKNSFPGVDLEKDYPTMADHHAHHGFVNNHPHIHDYT